MKFKITCQFCNHDDFEYDFKTSGLVCEQCGEELNNENFKMSELEED